MTSLECFVSLLPEAGVSQWTMKTWFSGSDLKKRKPFRQKWQQMQGLCLVSRIRREPSEKEKEEKEETKDLFWQVNDLGENTWSWSCRSYIWLPYPWFRTSPLVKWSCENVFLTVLKAARFQDWLTEGTQKSGKNISAREEWEIEREKRESAKCRKPAFRLVRVCLLWG